VGNAVREGGFHAALLRPPEGFFRRNASSRHLLRRRLRCPRFARSRLLRRTMRARGPQHRQPIGRSGGAPRRRKGKLAGRGGPDCRTTPCVDLCRGSSNPLQQLQQGCGAEAAAGSKADRRSCRRVPRSYPPGAAGSGLSGRCGLGETFSDRPATRRRRATPPHQARVRK